MVKVPSLTNFAHSNWCINQTFNTSTSPLVTNAYWDPSNSCFIIGNAICGGGTLLNENPTLSVVVLFPFDRDSNKKIHQCLIKCVKAPSLACGPVVHVVLFIYLFSYFEFLVGLQYFVFWGESWIEIGIKSFYIFCMKVGNLCWGKMN